MRLSSDFLVVKLAFECNLCRYSAARSAYSDKIRDGSWVDATFPPRYPVTPKEKEEAEAKQAAQVLKEKDENAAKAAIAAQKEKRETVAKAAAAAERSAAAAERSARR